MPLPLLRRMVAVLDLLQKEVNSESTLCSAGRPWDLNLRDLMRWCNLIEDSIKSGSKLLKRQCVISLTCWWLSDSDQQMTEWKYRKYLPILISLPVLLVVLVPLKQWLTSIQKKSQLDGQSWLERANVWEINLAKLQTAYWIVSWMSWSLSLTLCRTAGLFYWQELMAQVNFNTLYLSPQPVKSSPFKFSQAQALHASWADVHESCWNSSWKSLLWSKSEST